MGAWIETLRSAIALQKYKVAPLVGAWIETLAVQDWTKVNARRTPRGCVD